MHLYTVAMVEFKGFCRTKNKLNAGIEGTGDSLEMLIA